MLSVRWTGSEEESDVIADIVERLTDDGRKVITDIAEDEDDDLQEAAQSVLDAANAG